MLSTNDWFFVNLKCFDLQDHKLVQLQKLKVGDIIRVLLMVLHGSFIHLVGYELCTICSNGKFVIYSA